MPLVVWPRESPSWRRILSPITKHPMPPAPCTPLSPPAWLGRGAASAGKGLGAELMVWMGTWKLLHEGSGSRVGGWW